MKVTKNHILSSLILSLVFMVSSCYAAENQIPAAQEIFGADVDYFLGLQFLADEKENQARQKFMACMKNGSYFCAKKSAEALTTMGNLQDKNRACENMLAMFPDEDSVLIAARQFYLSGEYNKVIEITNNISLETSDNELIKLRVQALNQTNSTHYKKEVFQWYISRAISDYHYTYYRDTYSKNLPETEKDYSLQQFIITYRMDMYKKNYSLALAKAQTFFELFQKADAEPYPLLVSDIGKAYLYGSEKYKENAKLFSDLAQEYSNFDAKFYFWFYAGRFYDKAGDYYIQAINCFENAIQATTDEKQKDNALWYLLQTKINQSYTDTISELGHYATQWSDPEYFDDLFNTMIPSLMVNGNWKYFGTLLNQIDGYASNETTAKVAYIYGRLLQEGYIKTKNKDAEIERAFTRALNCGINPYYKILASYRLGYSQEEMERILCINPGNEEVEAKESAANLLLGYKYFGYPEKIYPEWVNLYKLGVVSTDVSMELAQFLSECGKTDSNYYPLSIRISARSANTSTRALTKAELKLVYPKYYTDFVKKYSAEYEIDENLMFALIRSESFFDEDVSSVAGAVGLTQLMELTGQDIAAKLKKKDYSLLDPETNIQFGTYYIAELIKRCDNSNLQAIFSYNAGITRVRRWLSSSMVKFGKKKNMPGDLFLETIPYSETREYGRKLVSASLFYEWLYFDETSQKRSFSQIVESFIY